MDSNEPIGYFNFNSEITYSKTNENFGVVNIDLNNDDNENADDESESNVYFHLSDLSEKMIIHHLKSVVIQEQKL